MKTLYIKPMSWICILLLSLSACKNEFLDAKPNKALLVPTTLSDFDAILDNNDQMNKCPYLPAIGSDDLFVTDAAFQNASNTIKNTYTWNEKIYEGELQGDWRIPYSQVFYANIVLDGLAENKEKENPLYQTLKGEALFYRSLAFFQLIQNYTVAYQKTTASQQMGIPLLLSSDVTQKYDRGNLQRSYNQIIKDLITAIPLLPIHAKNIDRPGKAAGLALLARVYLCTADFDLALGKATECLNLSGNILDYNTLTLNIKTSTIPFPKIFPQNLNAEVLFNTGMLSPSFVNSATTMVNPDIVASYADNDLRKPAFLYDRGGGVITFKGKYSSSTVPFSGLALDEVLLTRSECYARLNKFTEALNDLNALLVKRYKTGTYLPYTIGNTINVLALILAERRKELICRGTRWMDLKRLNLEPANATTLTRNVNGLTYTLLPNSKRYALPIPDEEILISGLPQNIR